MMSLERIKALKGWAIIQSSKLAIPPQNQGPAQFFCDQRCPPTNITPFTTVIATTTVTTIVTEPSLPLPLPLQCLLHCYLNFHILCPTDSPIPAVNPSVTWASVNLLRSKNGLCILTFFNAELGLEGIIYFFSFNSILI